MIEIPGMNLRIDSDGTPEGTSVHVGDTRLLGVTSIAWKIAGPHDLPEVTLTAYAGKLSVVVPIEAHGSRMRHYILDAAGEPVPTDWLTWARWRDANDDARGVAVTQRDAVLVSTVFLGMDHGWGAGPPVLWETMIFGGDHHDYQERYTSRADALAGHRRACALAWPGGVA